MARKAPAVVQAPAPQAPEAPQPQEPQAPGQHTLVISNVDPKVFQALLLKTFKDIARSGVPQRISVSKSVREILDDWYRREGQIDMR